METVGSTGLQATSIPIVGNGSKSATEKPLCDFSEKANGYMRVGDNYFEFVDVPRKSKIRVRQDTF